MKNDASEDPKMNGMKREKFITWKQLTKNDSGQMKRGVVEDIGVKKISKKRMGKKEQGKNREERNLERVVVSKKEVVESRSKV